MTLDSTATQPSSSSSTLERPTVPEASVARPMSLGSRWWPSIVRTLVFGAVGASGIVVDLSTFAVLLAIGATFGPARAGAIFLAMTWNFTLHRLVTYRDRSHGPVVRQYVAFCGACLVGAAVNWVVSRQLFAATTFFGEHQMLAALAGIVAGFAFNFLICNGLVFRASRDARSGRS